jgi:hypothetical protein
MFLLIICFKIVIYALEFFVKCRDGTPLGAESLMMRGEKRASSSDS